MHIDVSAALSWESGQLLWRGAQEDVLGDSVLADTGHDCGLDGGASVEEGGGVLERAVVHGRHLVEVMRKGVVRQRVPRLGNGGEQTIICIQSIGQLRIPLHMPLCSIRLIQGHIQGVLLQGLSGQLYLIVLIHGLRLYLA